MQLPLLLVMLVASSLSPAIPPVEDSAAEAPPPGHPYVYQGYDHYVAYNEFENRIYTLQARAPGIIKIYKLDTSYDGGKNTYDNHYVYAIKISDNVELDEGDEPSILIVGEHHAREWLSVMVPLYYAKFLVENYGLDPTDNDEDGLLNEDPIDGIDNDNDTLIDEDENEARITELVDSREIWIIPMFNPDGYVYDGDGDLSQRESWRKNREPNYDALGREISKGTDLNRNYAFRWGEEVHFDENGQPHKTVDDPNPYSDTYRGPYDRNDDDGDLAIDEDPWNRDDDDSDGRIDEDKLGGFSTGETRALRQLVEGHDRDGDGKTDFTMSLSYHSHGEWLLYPWAYTPDPSPDAPIMHSIAMKMAAMNHFPTNRVGQTGDILYTTSGDWMDWIYGTHYQFAFTVELDGYGSGFYPTEEHIIESALRQLPVNLYASEIADNPEAEYDPSLAGPSISYNHTRDTIDEGNRYRITARVSTPFTGGLKSVTIHYAVSKEVDFTGYAPQDIRKGDFRTVEMMRIGNSTNYTGSIPEQDGGRRVWYYITAEDVVGNTVAAPEFGKSEPYSYFVDRDIGISWIPDSVALVIMIVIFYGIIWGGFGAGIRLGLKRDKEKGD